MTVPMSSPLKVRERRGRIWAEDANGGVVLDGRTREHWPERYVAQTARGTHRGSAAVKTAAEHYLPIIDAGGREFARIVMPRRDDWVLRLATGEQAAVRGKGGMLTGISCTIGEFSSAVAPRLAPQRYITVTLADAVLA